MTSPLQAPDVSVTATQRLYVAAIGASAGGLEAISEFLQHLPVIQSLAVIIAQHLSPSHKSHLVELLARVTQLEVQEIMPGTHLKAGVVYIIPPDSEASLQDQSIQLSRPSSAIGPKPSADVLFMSLARQTELHPIGIVLSGTGTDGALGLAEIKAAGGWTFVQTPESARYDGMPQAALQASHIDYVLTPARMGETLSKLIQDPSLLPVRSPEDSLSDQTSAYQELMHLLTLKKGTDFANYKPSTILRRLQKRLSLLNLPDQESYLARVRQQPEELEELFRNLLISVTGFFRDPEVFVALKNWLQRLLQQKAPGDAIRIWVTGCATGEEAYSIALLLYQLLGSRVKEHPIQIFATDIDEQAIATARRGIYPASSLEQLPLEFRSYFSERGADYELSKSIRNLVLFSRHDITVNPPFLKLDLISCRNLLIYFGSNLQKLIIPVFHYALNPDGMLMLGKSENIGPFSELFQNLDNRMKLFQRKGKSPLHPRHFQAFKPQRQTVLPPVTSRDEWTLHERVRETLFSNFDFPYVVINDDYEILQVTGDVSDFLSLAQGRMTTQLLKLCRSELQVELRALISTAVRQQQSIMGTFRRWLPEATQKPSLLRIQVKPMLRRDLQQLLIVVFETVTLDKEPLPLLRDPEEASAMQYAELEYELAVTREHLQSFISELENSNEEQQALNEELQAAIEELQAANEELETTNEELQSTNEEMQVAYNELRATNEALEQNEAKLLHSRSRMQALLENTVQAFILLDLDYRVLAYNPLALEIHRNLFRHPLAENMMLSECLPTEILQELKPKLLNTPEGVVQHELKIETLAGPRWLRYHFVPVLNQNAEREGISLSAVDITPQMQAHQELEANKALINSIFNATDSGICVSDEEGRIIQVNEGYCRIYGYQPKELEGQLFTLVIPPSQHALARKAYQSFMQEGIEAPTDWLGQHKNGQILDVQLSARLLINPDGSRAKVTTVQDISERTRMQNALRDSEERFRALLENSADGIVVVNAQNFPSYVSPSAERLLGYSADELQRQNLLSLIHPEEATSLANRIRDMLKHPGQSFVAEYRLRHASGHWLWIECAHKNMLHEPRLQGLVFNFRDITERKETATRLQEHEQLYRSIADHFPNGTVTVLDAGLRCLFSDGEDFFPGLEPEQLEGKLFPGCFPTAQGVELEHRLQLALRGEPQTFELSFEERFYLYSVVPLRSPDSEISRLLVVAQNISLQKQAESEQKLLIQELTRKNEDLSQFTYIISHNLRAPVANLLGLVALLDLEADASELSSATLEILKSLDKTAHTLDEVILDLNQILNIRRQRHEIYQEVQLNTEVERVLQSLEFQYGEIRNWLKLEVEQTQAFTIRSYVQSILHNLLSNALKYRHPEREPEIQLRIWSEKDHLHIRVCDNGLGIEPHCLPHVFMLYKRFHGHVEGKGLGLYLVKTQAKALGGDAQVKSAANQGTTFDVYFRQAHL